MNPDTPLSMIVPVFNEHENFPRLVQKVEELVRVPFRMAMVYDFDADTTVPVAQELAATRPWLTLVRNDLGRGPANAIRAGFQHVQTGPALVVMADLSDDLRDIPTMLELYQAGHQIVCASRYMRGGRQVGGPFLKRTMSRTAGMSLRYLIRFPTHDATNNFRLYDAALVNAMGIESERGFEFALEMTAKGYARGVKIAQIPTTWTDRTAGTSAFQIRKWLPLYLRWYFYALRASVGLVPVTPVEPVATPVDEEPH